MSTNELHDTIRELKEFKLLKEEAEARIAELEDIIKDTMREQETDKLICGEYKCTLTTVGRNSLDSKAIQKELPDIYNNYLKTTSYQRFTVA